MQIVIIKRTEIFNITSHNELQSYICWKLGQTIEWGTSFVYYVTGGAEQPLARHDVANRSINF